MRPICPALLTAIAFAFAACLALNVGTNSRPQMPVNPTYDEVTLSALLDYFQTFSPHEKP
jgi:hypothetical protein